MTPPDPLASGGKVVFFLVLVVGLIFLVAWLVNKTRVAGSTVLGGKTVNGLRIISVLSLGMKEKIVVVQAGNKQLVVGVTAHQMTLLSELDEPLPVPDTQAVSFSELLKKAIRS